MSRMGYVEVNFLGEKYEVSEAVKEFLEYDGLLSPILQKIVERMTFCLERDSKSAPSNIWEKVEGDIDALKKIMVDGADLLLKKLLDLGVYDVTVNDLLSNIDIFSQIDNFVLSIGRKLCNEGERFVQLKNQGLERMYNYASSGITGSGIGIFTNSISALMVYSAMERSIVLSQAKKADRIYQESARRINDYVNSGFEKMCRDVMLGEYYPELMQLLLEYPNQIMSQFLNQLIAHDKFDFDSIQQYNMNKADEMLKNIDRVADKEEFLKQSFLTCPFSSDLYEKCLELQMLDFDTFQTAKYFEMGDELDEKIENYVRNHQDNFKYVKILVEILASYRGKSESDLFKVIYKDFVEKVVVSYREFNEAIANENKLDIFIRGNIAEQTSDVITKTLKDVSEVVDKKINSLLSERSYIELIDMGVLKPADIRMAGSTSDLLKDINNEISKALIECILDYIEEGKRRWNLYVEALEPFEAELKVRESELNGLKKEKGQLGLFALSKKRQLQTQIDIKTMEISEFKKKNEPKDLREIFEKMYR